MGGRPDQMGQSAGKKGETGGEKVKGRRRKEREKREEGKKKRGGEGRGGKKREIHVRDGGLPLSPPPTDLTAPSVNPLKKETVMIAHTWRLTRVRRGWGGRAADAAVGNMYFGLSVN